jgi:HEPN domain-containing protein
MNRSDLQELSNARIREAKILFAAGEYSGAYYLAGYAVECALKACIAKSTQQYDFPDKDRVSKSYSHDLAGLIRVAKIYDDFESAMLSDPVLEEDWIIVKGWSEQSRYGIYDAEKARAMLDAIERQLKGVLPWIQRHW